MVKPIHAWALIGLLVSLAARAAQVTSDSQPATTFAYDWPAIIKGLSSDSFVEREAAQHELDKVPEEEISDVQQLARTQKDEEVKSRLLARVTQMQVTMANYFNSGNEKNAKGDWKGAISDYTKGLARQPQNSVAYLSRGNARDDSGDFVGAQVDYAMAIELNPQFAPNYMNRAISRSRHGDLDGALADYDKAIQLSPNDADNFFYRAMTRQKKNDLDGTIADYSRSLQLRPEQVDGYLYRGILEEVKGDDNAALQDFASAVARNPARIEAHYYMGVIHYDRQAWALAAADFREEIKLNPTGDSARTRLWLTQARQGTQAAATLQLQQYLDTRDTSKADPWSLALCNFLTGRLTEAQLLKAADNPDKTKDAQQHCEAYFYSGTLLLLANDKTAAADHFKKCAATGMLLDSYQSARLELDRLKEAAPAQK